MFFKVPVPGILPQMLMGEECRYFAGKPKKRTEPCRSITPHFRIRRSRVAYILLCMCARTGKFKKEAKERWQ